MTKAACPSGYRLQDLHVYDPATMAWTNLSTAASGTPPSGRESMGFAAAGGKLYVHGGFDDSGEGTAVSELARLA